MEKMLQFLKIILVLRFVLGEANGTLTPNGTISLDCGSQQTFTCRVNGLAAVWTISGLHGIIAVRTSGGGAASNNDRIINPLANGISSSTITIIGFNASDNRGTIECAGDDGVNLTVEGMAMISVGLPSCPTSFSANRDGDFTSATVTYQLATPPVTSTTVTYCPTSSPNCGNMTCTSPCTISGLDPCVNYSLSAIPNNNCGSPMGCTGNSMVVASQGLPSCAKMIVLQNGTGEICSVNVMWQQTSPAPPVTFTTVSYCPTSSPNCGDSVNCTTSGTCNITGLDPGMGYNFTVIPANNCGHATECTKNSDTTTGPSNCTSMTTTDPTTTTLPVAAIAGGVVGGLAGVGIGALVIYAIAVLIAVLCCSSCEGRSYCHVFFCQYCCGGESKRPSSTRPMSAEEYADPKKVREKKEKEDKIQYAALEFSEQAGSSGEKPIRSKEEPVQYLAVEQA